MIRFILVILTAFLYLILSIPVLLVLLLIRKKKPEVCDKVSRSLIRWIFRVILFFSGTKITVKGQENIPKDRAVLYLGNHRSYFDILHAFRCLRTGWNSTTACFSTAPTSSRVCR